jgi:hypothetical protein
MKHLIMLKNILITFISKTNTCILTLSLISTSVSSETYHFASHGGGAKKEEFLDFKVDDAENSYVLLKYDTNVTFGNDTYSNKSKNSLIVQYDKNGNQLMTKDIVAEWPNNLFGAIGVSGDGNVVASSWTKSGTLDGHEVYGGHFIGKLGSNGNFEWVMQPIQTIDGARQFIDFRVTAIEVTQNEIYVAASANGKITLNGVTDPGYAFDNIQSAMLIKMDPAGTVHWIKQIPTPDVDNHPTIDGGMDHILPSADGQSIYVAGKVGDGSYNPYEVAYVAKFKTDGTFLWVKRTSSSGADSWGIAEASNGDLITGFGIGGAQVIDFGEGARLEASDTGWFGALVRFDKDGNVKTLKYVADALYNDFSNMGASNMLRLYHVTINQNDQAILMGQIVGTHSFKNGIETTSTPGLAGASKDAAIIICDLNFNPVEVVANTGGNNEWGRKCVSKGNKIYYSGEYDSFSHPFFGSFKPKFGEFTFESAGNQDIYVTSVSLSAPLPPSAPRLNIIQQGSSLTLSWPSSPDINAVLEFSPSLSAGSWGALDLSPILENGRWQITLPVSDDSGFYRLMDQE